jgi:hypothetical protein
MIPQKHVIIVLISIITFGTELEAISRKKPLCVTKKSCLDLNNKCTCYCSEEGGPRKKKRDDNPIFVPNDANGQFCYCNKWDLDNYPYAERRTKK